MRKGTQIKIGILVAVVALTVGIHYGWILELIFGHHDWVHAVHSRFCYIPIAIAAAWFGIRGGVATAAVISLLVVPYLLNPGMHPMDLSGELVEIFFYFAIGILIGALIDREMLLRRRQEQTQLQLERSHQLSLVGRMAAGVAHEIKNPLASIKGAVEILADPSVDTGSREEFSKIVSREIKRIDGTVKEFLTFARPKESKIEILNLSEVVSATIRQAEPQLAAGQMTISSEIAPNIKCPGDAEKLHQVVLNLLLNAMEASADGSTIHVTLDLHHYDELRVHLTVRDEGRGIDPADVDKVFEPFFTTKATGTGLGLAVVKAIIDNHRGTITLTSRPNEGTIVTIALPETTT